MEKLKEAVSEYAKAVEAQQKAVEANPAVSVYANDLAFFNNNLGDSLVRLGLLDQALQAYQKAAKTLQPLADAWPDLVYRRNLGLSRKGIGKVLLDLGRPIEALPEFGKASELYRNMANVQKPWWYSNVAELARYRGTALQKLGRAGEAVAAYRESITLLEKLAEPEPVNIFDMACCYALIHGAAPEKGSGVTTADAQASAEQAMAALRRATAAGYHDLDNMRKDIALDSLRKRPDFEKLLADLETDIKASGK
jgi:tetratricopeptide (TPR) repeat protein